jgi:hypothetical protein
MAAVGVEVPRTAFVFSPDPAGALLLHPAARRGRVGGLLDPSSYEVLAVGVEAQEATDVNFPVTMFG